MQKVDFTYKNGRQRQLSARDAELLRRVGAGSYLVRDVVAAPRSSLSERTSSPATEEIDLDGLGEEALRSLASVRGVKVHHKAGPEKVRAALREASELNSSVSTSLARRR